MKFTNHFREMLKERAIQQSWVDEVLSKPERTEDHKDGTKHFLRRIPEYGNRWLRVIVNIEVEPQKVVTAFFDRRIKGES